MYPINKNIKKIKMTKKQTIASVKETIEDWLIEVFEKMSPHDYNEIIVNEHGIEIVMFEQYVKNTSTDYTKYQKEITQRIVIKKPS